MESPDLSEGEVIFYGAVVVNLMRIYDVLLMQLMHTDPESAATLRALHREGKLFAPPPAINREETDD